MLTQRPVCQIESTYRILRFNTALDLRVITQGDKVIVHLPYFGEKAMASGASEEEALSKLASYLWRESYLLIRTPTARIADRALVEKKGLYIGVVDVFKSGMVTPTTEKRFFGRAIREQDGGYVCVSIRSDEDPIALTPRIMDALKLQGWHSTCSDDVYIELTCATEQDIVLEPLSIKWRLLKRGETLEAAMLQSCFR